MKPEQSGITGGSGPAGKQQPAFFGDAAAIQVHNQAVEAEEARQRTAAAEARAFATRSPAARFAHYTEDAQESRPGSGFIDRVVTELMGKDGMALTAVEIAAIIGRAFIMWRQGRKKDADRLLVACGEEAYN